jgi:hypothetical protein
MASYFALLLFGALASAAPTTTTSQIASRETTETCEKISFNQFSWAVKGFNYHSSVIYSFPSHRIANGYVDFNITNLALSHTLACSARSTQMSDFFYGNQWYKCTDSAGNDAEFQFDKSSGRLDVQQKWTCTDSASV